MKKIITLAITLLIANGLSAQNLGVKVGANLEANYKYVLSETAFAEGSIGLNNWVRGVQLAATYNKPLTTLDLSALTKQSCRRRSGYDLSLERHRKISNFGELNAHRHRWRLSQATHRFVCGWQRCANTAVPNMPMTIL